jgi:hypothetical protein
VTNDHYRILVTYLPDRHRRARRAAPGTIDCEVDLVKLGAASVFAADGLAADGFAADGFAADGLAADGLAAAV